MRTPVTLLDFLHAFMDFCGAVTLATLLIGAAFAIAIWLTP